MCDPVTAGLVAVGEGLKYVAGQKVESAQKRDIAAAGQQYEAERGRQGAFTQENQGTVSDSLNNYSRATVDKRIADAAANRSTMYTNPLQAHKFVADMPADFDPNSVVMARNVATGGAQQAKALSQAITKAQLDAYGDNQTLGNIINNNNANRISMVNRISGGSARAGGIEQGTLAPKLAASAHAGDTVGSIGDLFTMAGMASGMSGGNPFGVGDKLFGAKLPVMGPGLPQGTPATYGRSIFGLQF